MENKIYVVEFHGKDRIGEYRDMTAVFSSMENAKKYINSEITRLSGKNVEVLEDYEDWYGVGFVNTFERIIDEDYYPLSEKVYATAYEYDIDCEMTTVE